MCDQNSGDWEHDIELCMWELHSWATMLVGHRVLSGDSGADVHNDDVFIERDFEALL